MGVGYLLMWTINRYLSEAWSLILFWHTFLLVFALPWLQLPRSWCSWRRRDCYGLPKLVELPCSMCLLILVGNITAWKRLCHLELSRRNPSRHRVSLLSRRFSVFVKWNTGSTFAFAMKQGGLTCNTVQCEDFHYFSLGYNCTSMFNLTSLHGPDVPSRPLCF